MHRTTASLLVFAALAIAPLASLAAPVTVPTDLNPGDTYRLVFVTSTTRDATSSNIADYNGFVTGVANTVPELLALGTTWTAIGSTEDVDARDNTNTNPFVDGPGVPIYRLDDTRVANDNDDLWDGDLQAAPGIYESGNTPPLITVAWTGTLSDGTAQPASFYLGDDVNEVAWIGRVDLVSSGWVNGGSAADTNQLPLYGISGELTVVPEPSTMMLTCFGAAAVVIWQYRRRRPRTLL